ALDGVTNNIPIDCA
ncbi:jg12053, partial [Pararge aegeria aegeria]